ncbi:MAG: hypothetical protein QW336_03165 [Candidatus Anstonellales archaeon]
MGFTETEAKIFEVSKNIDIAKTNLPGRNGIFNRPEINFKIPPSLLRGANTEEGDLLLNA